MATTLRGRDGGSECKRGGGERKRRGGGAVGKLRRCGTVEGRSADGTQLEESCREGRQLSSRE